MEKIIDPMDSEWWPETRFEQKGLNANRVISELMFEKI